MKAKTKLTLRPDQPGAAAMKDKYGERLFAVRYRYDLHTKSRYKTVELIEEVVPWRRRLTVHPNKLVLVRIHYGEIDLGRSIRKAGGQWIRESGVWKLRYAAVVSLGLQARMVPSHLDS